MNADAKSVAIVFADISGSTKLYDLLGNDAAREIVAQTLNTISAVVGAHDGRVIKTIGDEIFATFPDADPAAAACCKMHASLDRINSQLRNGTVIHIRAGLHYGPVIFEARDAFGDAVNVAARMVAQAKADQIITTQNVVRRLSPAFLARTRHIDRIPVKGKRQEMNLYELVWDEEGITLMASGIFQTPPPSEAILRLKHNNSEVVMNKLNPLVLIGRDENCHVVVNNHFASRQHVRIELRRNKFFIVDQSTNGTFVRFVREKSFFLKREEVGITGHGQISLGSDFNEESADLISFVHEA